MSFAAILWKDLRRDVRGKDALQAGLVIVLLFLVADAFSFASLATEARTGAAVLWLPLLFGSAALVGRGFASEADRGTLDLVRSLPVPLATHGWSRTLANALLLGLLAAATAILATALFGLPATAAVGVVLVLAVVGLAVVGTLAAAIATQTRAREVLLPILLVPAAIPLLQSGLQATSAAFSGTAATTSLLAMTAYDLLAVGVAWFLWPYALEGE